MNVTVACVFVTGHVPFTAEYVIRLKRMIDRVLPGMRFVCLTNREHELPATIETIHVNPVPGTFGWWAKINLFDPELPVFGRVLYLDLDVLVIGGLDEVVDYPSTFALAPDGAPAFKPSNGKRVVKRFNSSVMVWEHGTHPEIFQQWDQRVATRLWGDQDWIGELVPHASAMPAEWFPRLSVVREPPWPIKTKVVLCKKPKNAEAAVRLPWFREAWQ